MYIYLDESGDLGFDFSKPATTNYFVVTVLTIDDSLTNRKIEKAIERTLRTKVNRGKRKNLAAEIKGSKTNIKTKKYFYCQIKDDSFNIYTIVLNKREVQESLRRDKERLYNYIARQVIEHCSFSAAKSRIIIVLDRSKTKSRREAFDRYLLFQLEGSLPPKIPLEIHHLSSQESKGIQAADLFCWGIFKKYENSDTEWYQIFKDKILFEAMSSEIKKELANPTRHNPKD